MRQLLTPLLLAAATGLPVYPSAVRVTDWTAQACNTKKTSVAYRVSSGGWQSVADWYRARIAGAIYVSVPGKGAELIDPKGRDSVAIAESRTKTAFVLSSYDPPISPDRMAQIEAASRGDAAAKAVLAKCSEAAN